MKKVLALALATLAPGLAFAQGTFNFNNAYVASGILPGGTSLTSYTVSEGVTALADANFNVTVLGGLVSGAQGVDIAAKTVGNLVPLKTAASGGTDAIKTFRTGATAGYIASGGTVFDQAHASGTTIAVQVVAWSKTLGSDFATAFATWAAGPRDFAKEFGASAVMTITLVDGSNPNQPRLMAASGAADPTRCSTPGLNSFTMVPVPVPEPSVLALAGLGLAGAFMIRRRK